MKTLRRIILILLACIFLFCGGIVISVKHKYKVNERLYRAASDTYTSKNDEQASSGKRPADDAASGAGKETAIRKDAVVAPIEVDFEALQELNPEVIGWLYCADTRIDFPVCRADDNKYYISHNYARKNSSYGAIFADCLNQADWSDSNIILYGHHLTDGSMFATLDKWLKQPFFDEHPVMWILTPEQDYKVELFSAYYISAYDEAYTIFQGPSPEFNEYLQYVKGNSMVGADVFLDGEAKYVMLSTCAYVFSMARSVVHGKMIPVDSAGGVLIDQPVERAS